MSFASAALPFAVTDFALLTRAMRYKFLYPDDMDAIAAGCAHCQATGAALNATAPLRYADHQLDDAALYGHTPNMAEIDTRTVDLGRYFTEVEDRHADGDSASSAITCCRNSSAGINPTRASPARRFAPSSSSSARV